MINQKNRTVMRVLKWATGGRDQYRKIPTLKRQPSKQVIQARPDKAGRRKRQMDQLSTKAAVSRSGPREPEAMEARIQ